MKVLVVFLALVASLQICAWEGKVFDVQGKKVTIASSQTAGVRAGTRLYIIKDGKEVGQGRVSAVFHTKVEMTLTSGTAEKNLKVGTVSPAKQAATIAPAKKDEKPKWSLAEIPLKANWAHLAFGNGVFVLIAREGFETAVSTDGATWQFGRLPYKMTWQNVVFGNGVFIALSDGDVGSKFKTEIAAISTDGLNWTAIKLPKVANWRNIGFGNGLFIILESMDGDRVLVSSDGKNWSKESLPDSGAWAHVAFGNGRFVAITSDVDDKAAISVNGSDWSRSKLPVKDNWAAMLFAKGFFVACTMAGDISHSTDGVAWEYQRNSPLAGTFCALGFANEMFSMVRSQQDEIAFSSDLKTWTKEKLPAKGKWGSHAAGNGMCVVTEYGANRVAIRKF